jgi:hypothetical protein
MRAMTSLNLSRNGLGAEGAKHIACALKVSGCVLAIILAPLSCPSDQYFNCWCLLYPQDMRAISTVTVNTFPLPIQEIKSKTELDFSNKGLKVEDAIIIAALLPLNVSRTISTYLWYR